MFSCPLPRPVLEVCHGCPSPCQGRDCQDWSCWDESVAMTPVVLFHRLFWLCPVCVGISAAKTSLELTGPLLWLRGCLPGLALQPRGPLLLLCCCHFFPLCSARMFLSSGAL